MPSLPQDMVQYSCIWGKSIAPQVREGPAPKNGTAPSKSCKFCVYVQCSPLNCIVAALRNRLSWPMVWMHLITAATPKAATANTKACAASASCLRFALLRFCRHASSVLQVGSHVQGIFLRPIVAKKNKRAYHDSLHSQCTNASSHNKFAVQVDTITVNLPYRQAQETFYQRHLIWSQYFWGLHFPTMALWFFVTSLKK